MANKQADTAPCRLGKVHRRFRCGIAKNKAVYTAAPVAGGWAGAVIRWAGAVMSWAGAIMSLAGAIKAIRTLKVKA